MKMKDGMEYLGFRTGIACLGLLPYGWAEGFLCSLAGAGAGLGVFRRDLGPGPVVRDICESGR